MFRLMAATTSREGFLVDMADVEADDVPACVHGDQDLISEVSCRHILHWNYRSFTTIPTELLGRLSVCV